MKNLEKFTLEELIALYNNYIIVEDSRSMGSAFAILGDMEVKEVRQEITKRIIERN